MAATSAIGTLDVELLSARDLLDTDWFNKSDPYAILKCGNKSLRGATARNQGTSPTWNQKFKFSVESGVKELVIYLWDEDLLTRDDFLGTVSIPLSDAIVKGFVPAMTYSVILPSGKIQGEVKVKLVFNSKFAARIS